MSGAAFEKVRDGALDASFYYGDLAHAAVGSIALREIAYGVAAPAAWRARLARAGLTEKKYLLSAIDRRRSSPCRSGMAQRDRASVAPSADS